MNGLDLQRDFPHREDDPRLSPMPEDFDAFVGVLALLAKKDPDAFDSFVEVSTVPLNANGVDEPKRLQAPKKKKT